MAKATDTPDESGTPDPNDSSTVSTSSKTTGNSTSKVSGKDAKSGNPAKSGAGRFSGRTKRVDPFRDPSAGPVLSARFLLALLLIVVGVAWIAYYYVGVRPADGFGSFNTQGSLEQGSGPAFMRDLKGYNYLIGFGLLFVGLVISAHPKTPLGRGRGVVAAMLGCFLLGLIWIIVFYAIANDTSQVPVFDDLGQKNLFVGIVFMAVGFTFATRWE